MNDITVQFTRNIKRIQKFPALLEQAITNTRNDIVAQIAQEARKQAKEQIYNRLPPVTYVLPRKPPKKNLSLTTINKAKYRTKQYFQSVTDTPTSSSRRPATVEIAAKRDGFPYPSVVEAGRTWSTGTKMKPRPVFAKALAKLGIEWRQGQRPSAILKTPDKIIRIALDEIRRALKSLKGSA